MKTNKKHMAPMARTHGSIDLCHQQNSYEYALIIIIIYRQGHFTFASGIASKTLKHLISLWKMEKRSIEVFLGRNDKIVPLPYR